MPSTCAAYGRREESAHTLLSSLHQHQQRQRLLGHNPLTPPPLGWPLRAALPHLTRLPPPPAGGRWGGYHPLELDAAVAAGRGMSPSCLNLCVCVCVCAMINDGAREVGGGWISKTNRARPFPFLPFSFSHILPHTMYQKHTHTKDTHTLSIQKHTQHHTITKNHTHKASHRPLPSPHTHMHAYHT